MVSTVLLAKIRFWSRKPTLNPADLVPRETEAYSSTSSFGLKSSSTLPLTESSSCSARSPTLAWSKSKATLVGKPTTSVKNPEVSTFR